jgi:hypothetical protein
MTEQSPQDLPLAQTLESGTTEPAMPVDEPPPELAMELSTDNESRPAEAENVLSATVAAAATWHRGKRITGLWSINQNRNVWINLSTVGWRKLANSSDSGIVALNMAASHARQMNRSVDAYEDDKQQIKEIYVW